MLSGKGNNQEKNQLSWRGKDSRRGKLFSITWQGINIYEKVDVSKHEETEAEAAVICKTRGGGDKVCHKYTGRLEKQKTRL